MLLWLLTAFPLEMTHSSFKILVIYLVGVISGSMMHYIFSQRILVGASGGCFAFLALHLANLVLNMDSFKSRQTIITFILILPPIAQ